MTSIQQSYRAVINELTRTYVQVLERPSDSGHWTAFRSALTDAMQWSSLIHAAHVRRVSLGRTVSLPGEVRGMVEAADLADANPWMIDHLKWSMPSIREIVRQVTAREKAFVLSPKLKRQRRKGELDLTSVPMWRLGKIYFAALGETAQIAENLQLSEPDVSEQLPFAEYVSLCGATTRRTHCAMNGFVALREGDGLELLKVVRPPNGYNCYCRLRYHSWASAISHGWATGVDRPKWEYRWPNDASRLNFKNGLFPDVGWNYDKFVAAA